MRSAGFDEGGNDYPIKAMGIRTHAVTGWHDTADFVTDFISRSGRWESTIVADRK